MDYILIVAFGMQRKEKINYISNVKRNFPPEKRKKLRFVFGQCTPKFDRGSSISKVIFDLKGVNESKTIHDITGCVEKINKKGCPPNRLMISRTGNRFGCKSVPNFDQIMSFSAKRQVASVA